MNPGMVPGDGVEGPFFVMVPGDACFLLARNELRESGTGTINERSEFNVIVESRDHFLSFRKLDYLVKVGDRGPVQVTHDGYLRVKLNSKHESLVRSLHCFDKFNP